MCSPEIFELRVIVSLQYESAQKLYIATPMTNSYLMKRFSYFMGKFFGELLVWA